MNTPAFSVFVPIMCLSSPSEGFLLPGPLCFCECRWERPPGTEMRILAAGRHWSFAQGPGDTGGTRMASAGTALPRVAELCDLGLVTPPVLG